MVLAKGQTGSVVRIGYVRHASAAWALAIGLSLLPLSASAQGDRGNQPVILVATIEGMIDLGLVPFVKRVLREAESFQAAAVVFEINTFGGRVDAAVAIRDELLRSPKLVVAFVNKRAISAGALIALSAQKIVMASGGTMGAATPVQLGARASRPSPPTRRPSRTCARSSVPPPTRASAQARSPRPWSTPTWLFRGSSRKASCSP